MFCYKCWVVAPLYLYIKTKTVLVLCSVYKFEYVKTTRDLESYWIFYKYISVNFIINKIIKTLFFSLSIILWVTSFMRYLYTKVKSVYMLINILKYINLASLTCNVTWHKENLDYQLQSWILWNKVLARDIESTVMLFPDRAMPNLNWVVLVSKIHEILDCSFWK